MVSAVRSRPNHYDTLGLSPGASDDEIRGAFARMMGMLGARPAVAAASVGAAFEVLRNPVKRRAYDRALGLLSEPNESHWQVAGVARSSPGLMGSSWARLADHQAAVSDAPAPRGPQTHAEPVPPAESRVASFISSSLRDVARPIAPEPPSDGRPQAEPRIQSAERPRAGGEPDLPDARHANSKMALDTEPLPLELRGPALVATVAVAAAAILGAIAGASADDQQPPRPAKRDVTIALPVASPQLGSAQPSSVPAARMTESQMRRPVRPKVPEASANDKFAARQQLADSATPTGEIAQPAERGPAANQSVGANDAQTASQPDAPTAAAAGLSLPNRVVARTIERIGYACGSVVSTTAVAGAAPGVYRIACSSGQAFQATPVRGRYRFRRSGR